MSDDWAKDLKPGLGRCLGPMYVGWRCKTCKKPYQVHREHRNICPHCKSDWGFPMTLKEFKLKMQEPEPDPADYWKRDPEPLQDDHPYDPGPWGD